MKITKSVKVDKMLQAFKDALDSVESCDSIETASNVCCEDNAMCAECNDGASETKIDEDLETVIGSWDEEDSIWEMLEKKTVLDPSGFTDDYSLWHNLLTDQYICLLGDLDIYSPENMEPDYECDTYEEAKEFFDSYESEEDDIY